MEGGGVAGKSRLRLVSPQRLPLPSPVLTVRKPGTYTTEAAFMAAAANQTDCIKYYFDGWYRALVKAGGRLPPPCGRAPR